jgi:RimJ/RimL family protein N-acetyltransferase
MNNNIMGMDLNLEDSNVLNTITIKETTADDLTNVMELWNNGQVMTYVGFPQGLGTTLEDLYKWLPWAISKPLRCHYSIYERDLGYCGECFYNVDIEHGLALLDIKLLPKAWGKGIAHYGLHHAINKAFLIGNAERVYVDPHPDNKKAWILYEKLGFKSVERPKFLEEWDTYLEIKREDWI